MSVCGFVTLLGAPNAGKSTLLNQFLGTKLAIVTPKAQTTRTTMRGICIHNDAQIIFVDTPGIFEPNKPFEKQIVATAWRGLEGTDVAAVLIDARKGICKATQVIIDALIARKVKAVCILNKIDLVAKPRLLQLAEEVNAAYPFVSIFMVSALSGDGVEDIKEYLAAELPAGVWLYPEDDLTTAPLRFLASELTREVLFMQLHQELPYSITVHTEHWQQEERRVVIHQAIFVQKENQKKIVIGHGGVMLKSIGTRARHKIAELVGQPVHLQLFVKVRADWMDHPEYIGE
jgi:GTP-binding protein Era